MLADVVQFPSRKLGDHSSRLEDANDTEDQKHGIADPNDFINEFSKKGVVRDKHPNFYRMGFKSQAFIDITLSKEGLDDTGKRPKMEDRVRSELKKIDNIVIGRIEGF